MDTERPGGDRLAAILSTFRRHHANYASLPAETARQQRGNEVSLKLAYSGRAAFELVQNALDRCESRVVVALLEGATPRLVVGNDGEGVSVEPPFSYTDETPERRSDFHALCSLHTSNKSPDETIGNKGVGFRSVFSLGPLTQVWSQVRRGDPTEWWGLELHDGLTGPLVANRRADPAVARGLEALGQSALPADGDLLGRPSFYFPLPLLGRGAPVELPDAENLATLVVIPLATADARKTTLKLLDELCASHLHFVGLRPRKEDVVVTVHRPGMGRMTQRVRGEPGDNARTLASWQPSECSDARARLVQLARDAEHHVTAPGVALLWPALRPSDTPFHPRIFGYLPTTVSSPIQADIHADFQLGTDRTALKTRENEPVGRYNVGLLQAAAELHLIVVLQHLGMSNEEIRAFTTWRWLGEPSGCRMRASPAFRADLFSLLRPSTREPDAFVDHLQQLIFGARPSSSSDFARWALMAARFFAVLPPEGRARRWYDEFWEASAAWLDRWESSRRKKWERLALLLCDALRVVRFDGRAGAEVLPIFERSPSSEDDRPTAAVPLPKRRGRGESPGGRRVFWREGDGEDEPSLHFPTALHERGRDVTAYRLEYGFHGEERAAGLSALDRWDLLADLRQLPSRLEQWIPPPPLEPEAQYELVRYAAELFAQRLGKAPPLAKEGALYGWGWRAFTSSDDHRRAGRALATLFLPTIDGAWEAARQLDFSRIDAKWTARLEAGVPGLDARAFFLFLGASPIPGLSLVEGGRAGWLEPRGAPPGLTEADGNAPPLAAIHSGAVPLLPEQLTAHWQSLAPLLSGGDPFGLKELLGKMAWVPARLCQFPAGANPEAVPPSDIVLTAPTDRRRAAVTTLHTPAEPLGAVLLATGASAGFDELGRDHARPALRLLTTLRALDLTRAAYGPTRAPLVDVHQLFVDAIARDAPIDTPAEPLLGYAASAADDALSERTLRWFDPLDVAVVPASNGERETLRRFFSDIALVAAVVGGDNVRRVPWLAARAVRIEERVSFEPLAVSARRPDVDQLKGELSQLLPGLLAIAETSRQVSGGVQPALAEERWAALELVPVAKAWVEYEVSGATVPARTARWLDDTPEVVLRDDRRILFDVVAESGDVPALRRFADALARGVLDNPVVAGQWALALAEFEARAPLEGLAARRARFDAHVKRQGGATLAESYAREMRPLTDEQRQRVLEHVQGALAGLGLRLEPGGFAAGQRVLSAGHVSWSDYAREGVTTQRVNEALQARAWGDDLLGFRPAFVCIEHHRALWERWLHENDRRARLAHFVQTRMAPDAGAAAASTLGDALMHSLTSLTGDPFDVVGFSPPHVAFAWLSERLGNIAPITAEALDERLPKTERFAEVSRIAQPASEGWMQRHVEPARPTKRELAPKTRESRQEEEETRSVLGLDAELALVPYVLARTTALLERYGEAGWAALRAGAAHPGGEIARRVDAARTGVLADALHVSRYVESAGFDILGLEEQGGAPIPIRHECKGMTGDGRAQVHVSSNQLAVFRSIRAAGPGKWSLTGVTPDGVALDLTEYLEPLLDDGEGPLSELARQGISADGFVIAIQRATTSGAIDAA